MHFYNTSSTVILQGINQWYSKSVRKRLGNSEDHSVGSIEAELGRKCLLKEMCFKPRSNLPLSPGVQMLPHLTFESKDEDSH